jgi:hypothetical protein
MTPDAPNALGPLFGPDFVIVTVPDNNKVQYSLEVYPDANNPLLKSNGLPQQFYYVPQRVYVAKKQDSPQDYDFGMTVFKGLLTSEDTVGVSAAQTSASGGSVEAGGGFCSFSTTFAVPDEVIANAITALKNKNYSGAAGQPAPPVPQRLLGFLDIAVAEPAPLLGLIPILSNDVTIDVPAFAATNATGGGTAPDTLIVNVQSSQKGSIEAKGISSFLVTCNELAAGAIAGSMQNGVSPFTVYNNLTEQFYLPACDITVTVDVSKTYDSFSVAASASGFFTSASFQAAWSSCITNGAIVTDMKMNEAAVPPDLKTFIDQNVQQMQTTAINLVKQDIFDWNPTDGGAASTSGPTSVLSSIFGGASVSMKKNFQRRTDNVVQEFKLDTTITMVDGKQGDLSDIAPAIKANIGKYLAIVDIGEYFKKIQVAATNAINWSETLPDGTSLADPISQAMIEVGYPDYDQPLNASGQPNLVTQAQGFHYHIGAPTGTSALAMWNATNPSDVINISALRLDNAIKGWPQDQVHVRKTLVFNANDPRVDLANPTVVIEADTSDHAPILTGQEVGYTFARFLCRPIPAAVTVTLTITLGTRTSTLTLTSANQGTAIYEVFSDKYTAATSLTYSVSVQVVGPDWTDNPIVYASAQPVTVPLPAGTVKYAGLVPLQLPPVPAAQAAQINDYIKRFQLQPVAAS